MARRCSLRSLEKAAKPEPFRVTRVPPLASPMLGVMELMVGEKYARQTGSSGAKVPSAPALSERLSLLLPSVCAGSSTNMRLASRNKQSISCLPISTRTLSCPGPWLLNP